MIGDNSRARRSVVVYFYDKVGKLARRPYVDIIPRKDITTIRGARQYTMRQGDDWHTLTTNRLGDMRLWWTIAEYNKIVDPFEAVERGNSIATPAKDVVFFDILDFDTPDVADQGGVV